MGRVDRWDEPHWESMVIQGVSMAPPFANQAVRVMFILGQFVNAAANDLLDICRGQIVAREQLHHDLTQHIRRVCTTNAAPLAADGGPCGIDNYDVFHKFPLLNDC